MSQTRKNYVNELIGIAWPAVLDSIFSACTDVQPCCCCKNLKRLWAEISRNSTKDEPPVPHYIEVVYVYPWFAEQRGENLAVQMHRSIMRLCGSRKCHYERLKGSHLYNEMYLLCTETHSRSLKQVMEELTRCRMGITRKIPLQVLVGIFILFLKMKAVSGQYLRWP
jgi:hypothetical protein